MYYTFYNFSTCFNKNVPWLTQHGGVLKYLGESVMVCAWSCHFSLNKKGKHGICFGISARGNYYHSVDQVHAQNFLPKLIMILLEHCVVMFQWYKGFQMTTFMSALKGYKRRTHKRVGVPVRVSVQFSSKCQMHRAKLTSTRVLQCVLALG